MFQNKWKLTAISLALVIVLLTSCFVILYKPQAAAAKEPVLLDVSIEGKTKLNVDEFSNYKVNVVGGMGELSYDWSFTPADGKARFYDNGATVSIVFNNATEEPYLLEVKVYDTMGNFGVASMAISDPPTFPSYYLGVSTAPYSYMIKADGTGWYYAIDGNTGAVVWSSTNVGTVLQNVLGNNRVIHFGNGVFPISGVILDNFYGLILEGNGMYQTILKIPDSTRDNILKVSYTGNPPTFTGKTSYLTIRNIGFDGNLAGQSYSGAYWRSSYSPIVLINSQTQYGLTIENVFVNNSIGAGIVLGEWQHINIQNVIIKNAGQVSPLIPSDGIYIGPASGTTPLSYDVTINGLQVDGATDGGLVLEMVNDVSVNNFNIVNSHTGIYVSSEGLGYLAGKISINGGTINNTGHNYGTGDGAGIYLWHDSVNGNRPTGVAISNCIFVGKSGLTAIYGTCDNLIIGNNIFAAYENDINIASFNTTITGNTFQDANKAIQAIPSSSTGWVIANNVFNNTVISPIYGTLATNSIISGNNGLPISQQSEMAFNAAKMANMYSSSAQGTWVTGVDTAQVYNTIFYNNPGAVNDEVSYNFSSSGYGTLTLHIIGLTDNNRGISTVLVDGVSQGIIDWYAASPTHNVEKTLPITLTSGNTHTLTLYMATKNGASSNYVLVISALWLT